MTVVETRPCANPEKCRWLAGLADTAVVSLIIAMWGRTKTQQTVAGTVMVPGPVPRTLVQVRTGKG